MSQFRLRTVLVGFSLFILVLPVAGIQVLRLYESALVRQTESELIAQTAVVAAAFAAGFQDLGVPLGTHSREAESTAYRDTLPRFAVLDLAESTVYDVPRTPTVREAPDLVADRVGLAMEPVIAAAEATTLARIRIVDHRGTVVATTGSDRHTSLNDWLEVTDALRGVPQSRLHRRSDVGPALVALSRGDALRVAVSTPVVVEERILGAVLAEQTPATIAQALYHKRFLLLQAGAFLLVLVVGGAIFASHSYVRPIERLVDGVRRISAGDATTLTTRRYRMKEIDELTHSVAAMAASLQQRTTYVRELSRSVGHEFKTPIAAMAGTLEVLEDHIDEMETTERDHFLKNLTEDIDRLERLTQRLLELAHADMRGPSKSQSSIRDAAPSVDNLTVHLEGSAVETPLPIDHEALRAVLQNAAENSYQHGAENLTIRGEIEPTATVVDLIDDGCGISPGNRDNVFEPFFTTRRDAGGTGLGLAITKSLIQNAGGSISCRPPAAGEGAVIRLAFPNEAAAA